ncbi:MAG: HAD-IA family hydrolase [Firmicutes bacterium]|nr:HAD-IA family hydrolase [Bacillota bacterium]
MIKALIFDMDGTILNTIDDISTSINHAFTLKGYPNPTVDAVKMALGSGAIQLIERLAPKHLKKEEIRSLYETYQADYDVNNNNLTGPYPGIMDLLDYLKKQGYLLSVVSNKYEYLVKELNIKLFHNYFDVSIGDAPGIPIKPAPDMVYKALDLLKIHKDEALFIGDSDVDIFTAQNAGLKSVGVTWGFRDQKTLEACHADYIIHQPSELLKLLEGNPKS